MRAHRMLAAIAATVLADCGGPSDEQPPPLTVTSVVTAESNPSAAPSLSSTPSPSSALGAGGTGAGAPPGGASALGDVAAWIEAARPADPAAYRTATGSDEQGATTTTATTQSLGDGVAFRSPSKKLSCFGLPPGSDIYSPGLICLAGLVKPPAKPSGLSGQWIGGWVEYDGRSGHVGAAHGDPGPFLAGDGPILPYGEKISFGQGDERTVCRMDQTGLWCADQAKGSAIRLDDQGISAYGCLREISRRDGEGRSYAC